MAPLRVTLKVTFAVYSICVHPPRWFKSTMVRGQSNMRCRQLHWW